MQEEYIKETNIIEQTDSEKEKDLIKNIIKVKEELKTASINFGFAEDELVDYYIYQIKANQTKLNYLIKQAKERGISMDIINKSKNSLYDKELDAG